MTAAERREQLIEIARALFAQRGFDGTSIEEIAARAEVSKPVVYEHFGGKEGLYAVVVDREVRSLLGMMQVSLTAGHPRMLLEQAAPMYAQMLVGMVGTTGQWWLDARKPSKDAVAAHLVNLAWHGLGNLERKPRLRSKP